jgi:asparagine synthase (glutamine-hydrolysing)
LLLNDSFINKYHLLERQRELAHERTRPATTEKEHHLKKLNWGIMANGLEMLNKIAAAHKIEVYFPFWDKDLVEFCLVLPPDLKMRKGWTRFVLRQAMQEILPGKIQWRKGKGNLGFSFEHSFMAFEAERVQKLLASPAVEIGEYVNMRVLQRAFNKALSARAQKNDFIALWKTLNLHLWMQSVRSRETATQDCF